MWFLLALDVVQFGFILFLGNSVAKWIYICQEQGEHLKAVNEVLMRYEYRLGVMGRAVQSERDRINRLENPIL
jgi:hypothetical protein